MNDVLLGSKERKALLLMAILPKLFFSLLPDAVAAVGSAAWYAQIAAWAVVMGFAWILFHMLSMYPGQTLPEIFQTVLGKIPGRGLGFLFYLYFVAYTADFLGEAVQLIKIYNFPRSPFFVFSLGFLAVAWLIGRYGIYGVSQTAALFVTPVLLAIGAALLIGGKQYDFRLIFPLGGYSPIRTGLGILGGSSVYVDLILVLIPAGEQEDMKLVKRSVYSALTWCGGMISLCTLAYLLTFGYRSSQGKTVGLVELVQNIYFNQLFQRMEAVFFLVMVISAGVGLCIWFYMTSCFYSKVFGISQIREILPSTFFSIFALSIISRMDLGEAGRRGELIFRYGSETLFLLCALVWVIGLVQKRRRERG